MIKKAVLALAVVWLAAQTTACFELDTNTDYKKPFYAYSGAYGSEYYVAVIDHRNDYFSLDRQPSFNVLTDLSDDTALVHSEGTFKMTGRGYITLTVKTSDDESVIAVGESFEGLYIENHLMYIRPDAASTLFTEGLHFTPVKDCREDSWTELDSTTGYNYNWLQVSLGTTANSQRGRLSLEYETDPAVLSLAEAAAGGQGLFPVFNADNLLRWSNSEADYGSAAFSTDGNIVLGNCLLGDVIQIQADQAALTTDLADGSLDDFSLLNLRYGFLGRDGIGHFTAGDQNTVKYMLPVTDNDGRSLQSGYFTGIYTEMSSTGRTEAFIAAYDETASRFKAMTRDKDSLCSGFDNIESDLFEMTLGTFTDGAADAAVFNDDGAGAIEAVSVQAYAILDELSEKTSLFFPAVNIYDGMKLSVSGQKADTTPFIIHMVSGVCN